MATQVHTYEIFAHFTLESYNYSFLLFWYPRWIFSSIKFNEEIKFNIFSGSSAAWKCEGNWLQNLLFLSTLYPFKVLRKFKLRSYTETKKAVQNELWKFQDKDGNQTEFNPCVDWSWFLSNEFLFSTIFLPFFIDLYLINRKTAKIFLIISTSLSVMANILFYATHRIPPITWDHPFQKPFSSPVYLNQNDTKFSYLNFVYTKIPGLNQKKFDNKFYGASTSHGFFL